MDRERNKAICLASGIFRKENLRPVCCSNIISMFRNGRQQPVTWLQQFISICVH